MPRGGVGGAALGRPVLIDPVSERVGGDVDVGGEPCGQAETVRDVQVEPDVSVAAGAAGGSTPSRPVSSRATRRPHHRCAIQAIHAPGTYRPPLTPK